jgi:hypothetical protein
MIIEPSNPVSGSWAKAAELENGTKAKIVDEAKWVTSQFKDKNDNPKQQLVAKVRFQGKADDLNVSLNRATQDGLIRAFGKDSNDWKGRVLTVQTEKVSIGGQMKRVLYLIPEGFVLGEDANDFTVIVPKDTAAAPKEAVVHVGPEEGDDEITADIPF